MKVPTLQRQGESGDALIFLHGIGGGASNWLPQLSFFGEHFQAIAWNMPGYSDSPPVPSLTFAVLADALERLMDALKISQTHLVGHSMGGMVAQEFMVQRQDRVKSLVLYATTPAFGKPDGKWQQEFVNQRLQALNAGGTMADVVGRMMDNLLGDNPDPQASKLARSSIGDCSPETYRKSLECLVTFERRANLPNISIPTLLLSGEKDTAAPAPIVEKMASKIPQAHYHCVPHAGHLIHLEQPQIFNKIVFDFLVQHAS